MHAHGMEVSLSKTNTISLPSTASFLLLLFFLKDNKKEVKAMWTWAASGCAPSGGAE